MANSYTIQSCIVTPDPWWFDKYATERLSPDLEFAGSEESGKYVHVVTYRGEAENLMEAWRKFHRKVTEFIDAASFYTSSYLAFHAWNYVIINHTSKLCLVSSYERSEGTVLGLSAEEDIREMTSLIERARQDPKLKHFLHNYHMAVMVDAPETQEAYEKYLILAAESLAGEVPDEDGLIKVDRNRLKAIIGKDLNKHFFSSISPSTGKTIRNSHMHIGVSPNEEQIQTLRLVNRMREFIKREYGFTQLPILDLEASPTRGHWRDYGGQLLFHGPGAEAVTLPQTHDIEKLMHHMVSAGNSLVNAATPDGQALIASM